MKLFKIKEDQKGNKIIITNEGDFKTDESSFSAYWFKWVEHPKADKSFENGFNVYSFGPEGIEI